MLNFAKHVAGNCLQGIQVLPHHEAAKEKLPSLVEKVLQAPGATEPSEWLRYVQDKRLAGPDMVCGNYHATYSSHAREQVFWCDSLYRDVCALLAPVPEVPTVPSEEAAVGASVLQRLTGARKRLRRVDSDAEMSDAAESTPNPPPETATLQPPALEEESQEEEQCVNDSEESWITPPPIMNLVRKTFHLTLGSKAIDLDPCASRASQKVIKAKNRFLKADDGLRYILTIHL